MTRKTTLPTLLLAAAASLLFIATTQGDQDSRPDSHAPSAWQQADLDKLHTLVDQTRTDLAVVRKMAGLDPEGDEHASRERREGRGEHSGREGRGEHAAEGSEGGHESEESEEGEEGEEGEGGEEGGKRMKKSQTWDETRNGAHLTLRYSARSASFIGTVTNKTNRTLKDIRVEVHLSNGSELGPTKRTDLKPNQSIDVELSAAGHRFSWWTTHPEHGSEEGHSHGGEGAHEHAAAENDNRPADPGLRPLYNELHLLHKEMQGLKQALLKRSHR